MFLTPEHAICHGREFLEAFAILRGMRIRFNPVSLIV